MIYTIKDEEMNHSLLNNLMKTSNTFKYLILTNYGALNI